MASPLGKISGVAKPHAPRPQPVARQYSFTDHQINNPKAPPPGDRLDGELDRAVKAIARTIEWAGVSLGPDGELRDGAIGQKHFQPELFDHIGATAVREAQRLADVAADAARQAQAAADMVRDALRVALEQHAGVAATVARAGVAAQDSADDARDAASSAQDAANSAAAAANSAGNADGSEAVCVDYGVLTQAWAEHMPDTIPPNILATMDVTGDHWSSRWWANNAAQIVTDASGDAVCAIQSYWLGAYANPPTHTTCGDPVSAGAMYWNTTSQTTQVYDGVIWHDVVQPAPATVSEYLYLPAAPTTVFTGVDYHGNTMVLDAVNAEIAVYLNGVKLLNVLDYTLTSSSVTLTSSVTVPSTVEVIGLKKVSPVSVPPSGVKVNTSIWTFDGVTKTFPLQNSTGGTLTPPGSVDCIVSLNGIIQEAGGDYTTRAGFIDFIVAPEADADKWMVVGLPGGGP
jgi:hypothetical protein